MKRYTGLVLKDENFFIKMVNGDNFTIIPKIDEKLLYDEEVEAKIMEVHAHPGLEQVLIVLRVTQCRSGRGMQLGVYALIFKERCCEKIPDSTIHNGNTYPDQAVSKVQEMVKVFRTTKSRRPRNLL